MSKNSSEKVRADGICPYCFWDGNGLVRWGGAMHRTFTANAVACGHATLRRELTNAYSPSGQEKHAGNTRWYFQGFFRSIGGKLPLKTYPGLNPECLWIFIGEGVGGWYPPLRFLGWKRPRQVGGRNAPNMQMRWRVVTPPYGEGVMGLSRFAAMDDKWVSIGLRHPGAKQRQRHHWASANHPGGLSIRSRPLHHRAGNCA